MRGSWPSGLTGEEILKTQRINRLIRGSEIGEGRDGETSEGIREPQTMSQTSSQGSQSEDSVDWEEVEVESLDGDDKLDGGGQAGGVTLSVVISKPSGKKNQRTEKRRTANSAVERQIRHDVHRAHTLSLLASGLLRNVMLNDQLLRARLLSLVPLPLVNAFGTFTIATHPLARDRSRMFDSALKDLISWWWQSFQIDNSIEGMRTRTWAEADGIFDSTFNLSDSIIDFKGKRKEGTRKKSFQDAFNELLESGEPLHGVKSLMKRAVLMKGSRDMSALLFTSLLRALDVPSRLVFSLQPVTWRGAGGGGKSAKQPEDTKDSVSPTSSKRSEPISLVKKPRAKTQGLASRASNDSKNKRSVPDHKLSSDKQMASSESEELPLANTGMASTSKEPTIKLRKSRPTKSSRHWAKSPSPDPEALKRPPVFWTEVYSRPMKEWYCVDVTRKKMRCKKIMEPSKNNPENRMLYVIAFEQDQYIRDVTPRYTHSFGATVMKSRLTSRKNGEDWFERATKKFRRPYKLARDEREDEELQKAQVTEAMPTTVGGFKDHPNFALERHLRREEVIYPKKPIGIFRGESVYPRSAVTICKSSEAYLREGKRIKGGEMPLKMVKPRTVTINRKREEELLKMDGQEVALQGLFADWQTELLIPPPIRDGIIPRNAYGNFDLFAPHMLPKGAKHLPYKGIAKTAKKLQVSYADAVVSFEFHKRRAIPVIEGIIVPELESEFVLDAYWTSEEAIQEKEFVKFQERCLKRWKKLIVGLQIRKRLQEEYKAEVSKVQSVKNTVEAPSELKNIGVQPEELSLLQDSGKKSHGDGPRPIFKFYVDHQVNTMKMPEEGAQDDYFTSLENDQNNDHETSKLKENDQLKTSEDLYLIDQDEQPGPDDGIENGTILDSPKVDQIQESDQPLDQPEVEHSTSIATLQPMAIDHISIDTQSKPRRNNKRKVSEALEHVERDPPSSPLSSPSEISAPAKVSRRETKSKKTDKLIDEEPKSLSNRPIRAAAMRAKEFISDSSPVRRSLRQRKKVI